MVNTAQKTEVKAWAKALIQPATEFGLTPLSIISGTIPTGLRGSLYRNGPARIERNGRRVGHWFDGDGAILAVHFTDVGATGIYRYVQTAQYQAEETAGKFLFGGYGAMPPGPFWQRFTQPSKNAANTSVLALPDKLLALWEGGNPHALDLETLDTLGIGQVDGLARNLTYSAHPKRDPKTEDIYNFGIEYGTNGALHIYHSDFTGRIQQQARIGLNGIAIIHDFVLTDRYLVFFVCPVRLNLLPVLFKIKTTCDAFAWRPELGTQLIVVDRDTLSVTSRGEAEPWFHWHCGNGYIDHNGLVVLDIVRFEDFLQTNQYLKEVATGKTQTAAKGTLWQIRLEPQSGKVEEMSQVLSRGCEFPVVAGEQVGQPWRYTYLSVYRQGVDISQELWGAIARFDYQTGNLMEAELGENCYPVEPIYAADRENPEQGWILTVVFNGNSESSEVWIFDADHLDDEPKCKLALPSVVPIGFHGTWKPA